MFNSCNARIVEKCIGQITKTQCRQWHTTLKNTLKSRLLLGAKTFTLRSLLSIPSVKTINKSNICTNISFIYINISFILINISFIYTFLRGCGKYPQGGCYVFIAMMMIISDMDRYWRYCSLSLSI